MVVRARDRDGTTRLTGTLVTFDTIYPIGSLYMSTSDVNPAEYFGGLWERFAQGRTLIGVNEMDSDFNTVEKLGGTKIHAHGLENSTTGARLRMVSGTAALMSLAKNLTSKVMTVRVDGSTQTDISTASTAGIPIEGTSDNASSLQPYITTYIWRRFM